MSPKKNEDSKRICSNQSTVSPQLTQKRHTRKAENPVRLPPVTDALPDSGHTSNWICKNAACRAILNMEDTFCKRCSCCICHFFDDNKDPSLWVVCSTDSGQGDSCGQSCHIECALEHQKAGVVNLEQLLQLDGSYCCASCGKVSGIIECWKKQLTIAKDARRVDVLCYRLWLGYRLLDGTSRFKELHEFVRDAKSTLETEIGPINGVSAKMARGIVGRLSVSSKVQHLCNLAIKKAESWSDSSSADHIQRGGSLPAACKIQFEDVTSSSVIIVLKDCSSAPSDEVQGYKLWYCKRRDPVYHKEPICILSKTQGRALISKLQPCTEYVFRIISFTEKQDIGYSETKCFTKSVEIVHKSPETNNDTNNENPDVDDSSTTAKRGSGLTSVSSGFKVRDLGKVLHVAWAQERGCYDEFCDTDNDSPEVSDGIDLLEVENAQERRTQVLDLDLNKASVPDLNAEVIPSFDCSGDDGSSGHVVVAGYDVNSNGRQKSVHNILTGSDDSQNCLVRQNGDTDVHAGSNRSGDSENWMVRPPKDIPTVESQKKISSKQMPNSKDVHDGEKDVHDVSDGSGDSQNWLVRLPKDDNTAVKLRRRIANIQIENGNSNKHDGVSTLYENNTSPSLGCLDGAYEYCVKTIRCLEREGHIEHNFRMQFLTWFSLRSTEQERRVVHTYIETLNDDSSSLAGQLLDSFSEIISMKRTRNGFCSKLWH